MTNFSYTTNVGKLTIDNYEDRTDGKVFDGDKLQELYNALLGKENATLDDIKYALSSGNLSSSNFRTNNPKKNDVIVEIGDMRWIATYLSNNRNSEPILTLWLANSSDISASYRTSQWSAFNTAAKGTYPAIMYATSKLRAVGLNNGGQYATSNTVLSSFTQDNLSPFAKFTMPNSAVSGEEVSGSLIKYIDTPRKVEWQETEEFKNYGGTCNYENDAYSKSIYGYQTGSSYRTSWLNNCDNYSDWQDDRLWIPSIAEMGYIGAEGKGMWSLSTAMYPNSADYWLRSPSVAGASNWNYCHNQGGHTVSAYSSLAIRPAFHLNLNEASADATTTEVAQGEKLIEYYDDGNEINFELLGFDATKLDITFSSVPVSGEASGTMTYKMSDGNAADKSTAILSANQVGKYTVTVKPKNGECWSDNTTTPKEFVYYIKYSVPETFIIGQTGLNEIVKPYDGTFQEFKLDSDTYDPTKFTVTANSSPSGLTFDDSSGEAIFKAKDVESYSAKIELKDKELMEWSSGGSNNKTLKIQITQRPLTLTFDPNGAWSVPYGEAGNFAFTDSRANSSDVLSFALTYAEKGTTNTVRLSPTVDGMTTKFTIPANLAKGEYVFSVTLNATGAGKNYVLNGTTEKDFVVIDKEIELTYDKIIWKYENLRLDGGNSQFVGTWDGNTVVDVNYTGAEFKFSVDESALIAEGVKLDRYETPTATVCGSYTTTVHLLPLVESSILKTPTFTIKWKISQGLYDLSGVYWDYADGELEYTGRGQTVELKGLLSSLVPQYTGNRQTNVGDNYLAKVNGFVNNDSNFKDPDINDPTTYIYKDGETFPWELVWKIVKKKISLSWEAKEAVDVNGRNFTYYVAAGEDADKISGYEYYRGDDYSSSGGGSATGSPIKFEDIVVVEKQVDSYWAVAILSAEYDNNYEIVSNKARLFSVGSTNDEVKVELNGGNHKFTYDGNAHGNELKVTTSALSVNDIVKTYYRGSEVNENNRLEGAPTDAGKYLLVMSLSAQDEEDFVLSTSRIEFEIEKAKITAIWNTEGQIPVISNLDDNLKEIVGYIYYDAEGNQLEDGAQLEVGKTYSVKAILKGNYGDNYEFVAEDGVTVLDDPTTTEEEEFTVKDSNNGDGNGIGGVGSGNQGGDGNGGGNVNFDNV
ncbi:MAG: hypothetical protein K2O35_04390, partial [Clostridia bacterium]|nr:hypothetical protein [Clostridia bacterium]